MGNGKEPKGELSGEGAYTRYFELQSEKWGKIAKGHLHAVWHTVDVFIKRTLGATRTYEEMLNNLRQQLIRSKLDKLKEQSYCTLADLLGCHGRDKTDFFDSLVDVRQTEVRERARGVAARLIDLTNNYIGEVSLDDDDSHEGNDRKDRMIQIFLQIGYDILLPTIMGARTALPLVKSDFVFEVAKTPELLHHGEDDDANGNNTGRRQPGERNEATVRVIERMETYYEVRILYCPLHKRHYQA